MSELRQRLARQYDERPAARVMAPAAQAHWVQGFGAVIADVRTLCAHMTAGWPRRDNADNFVARYITPGTSDRGIGTQLYLSGDGTVARLIDLPRLTFHGEWINGFSVGVETGNLGTTASPPALGAGGVPHWIQASTDAEDVPGAKLWITGRSAVQTEVMPGWWTTAGYNGPGRGAIGADHLLFSEQIMQAWALMARYLFEELRLPRNFPLLPHERRSTMIAAASAPKFRRTVLADERAEMVQRTVAAAPINVQTTSFDAANAATLRTEYGNAIVPSNPSAAGEQRHNRAWKAWCSTYRGLHGHGYAGSMRFHKRRNAAGQPVLDAAGNFIWDVNHEHDCPGPLFDFHRVAREVSDYWWYPFDVLAGSSAVPHRPYRRFQADTPIIEYYWDESEADRTARVTTGVHGTNSSPTTFRLDQGSPIYAMSNGELVAARFPDPGTGASMAFTLVRHEVYHARLFPSVVVVGGGAIPMPDSIDYNQAPESVYTLYLHLGRPAGMSFDAVTGDNPDWLNRLLVRKKECDLGVAFYDGHATHHGIAAGVWNNRPPGLPQRPTTLEGWRTDQRLLDAFLTTLARGDVAVLPRQDLALPGRVLLGDVLGESGVIRAAGPREHGVRVETFAPSFVAPTFSVIGSLAGWNPVATMPPPHCVQYAPEWTRELTLAERAALFGSGVNMGQHDWWDTVARGQLLDGSLPAGARLPVGGGHPFHYEPLAFARWINGVTWGSEWPKYEVTDASGNPVARPARPRSRRV